MQIINNVVDTNYTQWIENFIARVLRKARIKCSEVTIDDIEPSRRIFLCIGEKKYTIRTWNYHPVKYDKSGRTCAENVEYTLYEMVRDANGGGNGLIAGEGIIKIEWSNDDLG